MEKALVLVLALAFAPAFAADKCRLPRINIVGLDYHTARARLINADYLPMIPDDATRDTVGPGVWALAYLEGSGCTTGHSEFRWHGFKVYTAGDCFRVTKVICP
jgi:hypothetical protein